MSKVFKKLVADGGDLAKLTPEERSIYYMEVCESVGLNPLTEPFKYIYLKGKLQLYATRAATEQLRKINKISLTIVYTEKIDDIYIVRVRAIDKENRTDESTGVVSLIGLKGDDLANAYMRAETKAKRRVTLSISGLGYLDESELETVSGIEEGPAVILPDSTKSTEPVKELVKELVEEPVKEPVEEPVKEPVKEPVVEAPGSAEKEAPEPTGEILNLNIVVMGSPRKERGKDEYALQTVVVEPKEYEGEYKTIVPAEFKELLIDGIALEATGAFQGDTLIISSVNTIDVTTEATEPDFTSDLAVGQKSTAKLKGDAKLGKLPYKGEKVESYFSYSDGRQNTILFGDSLEGFSNNDIIKFTVDDLVEKDDKTLVIISAAEKIEKSA